MPVGFARGWESGTQCLWFIGDFSFPRNRSWHFVAVREMVIAGPDPFSGAQKNAHNGQQQKEEFSGLCYVT